jgi:hypothetical protein
MIKVIGIGGVARSGKDTLCKYLQDKFPDYITRFALADELKLDLNEFLKSKTNISAFTVDPKEKTLIRDLLVAYGKIKREQSQGRYWTSLLQPKIDECIRNGGVAVVTDIRYDFYPEDELFWLLNVNRGTFIHVTRTDEAGQIISPPNKDEEINNPKLMAKCNYQIVWPTFKQSSDLDYFVNNKLGTLLSNLSNQYGQFKQRVTRQLQ